jgi:putative phosphoesterase
MKIGVLSDTHIPFSAERLPRKVIKLLGECDVIAHAGDICVKEVIDDLAKLSEVKVVHGNMDSPDLKKRFPSKLVFEARGKKVGLIHGSGSIPRIVEYVRDSFKSECPDIIIFGHSHHPFNELISGVLYFNPGSPTDMVYSEARSFGIIEINDHGVIEGKIIDL